MKEIKQENFTLDLFFTKNYGLGNRPAMPALKKKGIVWGAILAVIGIIFFVIAAKADVDFLNFVGVLFVLLAALLIALPIVKRAVALAYRNKWDAEFTRRFNEWPIAFDNEKDRIIKELNLEEKGRDYLGIDVDNLIKDEKGESSSFYISGNNFTGYWRSYNVDGKTIYRTEKQTITWLYFGVDEIYIYKVEFSLRNPNSKSEDSNEFFYKDIVSVSVAQTSSDAKGTDPDAESDAAKTVENEEFRLVVPGEKLSYSYTPTPYASSRINAMKSMIRDKKTH